MKKQAVSDQLSAIGFSSKTGAANSTPGIAVQNS